MTSYFFAVLWIFWAFVSVVKGLECYQLAEQHGRLFGYLAAGWFVAFVVTFTLAVCATAKLYE